MSSGQEVGTIFGDGSGPAAALLRSPTVIIASVGLWGMNVYFFRVFRIDYIRVLNLDLMREMQTQRSSSNLVPCDEVDSGGFSMTDKDTKSESQSKKVDKWKEFDAEMVELTVLPDPSIGTKSGMHGRRSYSRSLSGSSSADEDSASDEFMLLKEQQTTISGSEVTEGKLLYLSGLLMLLLHLSSFAWINIYGGSTIGAIFAYYAAVTFGILVPLPSTQWVRTACIVVIQRTCELFHPRCRCRGSDGPRPIPFLDVFFADAMCSMSKVFFDWGMLWHLASYYPDPVPASAQSIIIPSVCASLPYVIRARQCLVMHAVGKHKNDPKRYQHLLNALKYSTSLFPLIVSAYQKVVSHESARRLDFLLIFLLGVNALYALAWDIVMDWGMMQNPIAIVERTVGSCGGGASGAQADKSITCHHVVLRPRLRFGALSSSAILMADILLRFSWLLRFYERKLFPNTDAYILCTEFLEVFRRAIWNLLRVEWENIKQMRSKNTPKGRLSENKDEEQSPFLASKPVLKNAINRTFA